jgi:hypothetical protein
MVHFKHLQISCMRVAAGKGIQSGAEDDVLRHALLDSLRQLVFSIPAPCRHKRTKGASHRVIAFFGTGAQFLGGFRSDNRHGQGIVEDFGLVKKLMGGASESNLVRGPAESSLLQRNLSCLGGSALGAAFFTRAYIPQKLPGINAQLVPIIPLKLDGVFAHALGRQWLGRLLEHWQRSGCQLRPFAELAARLAPLVVAKGAGAGIAEEGKCVVRAVAILPLDVQA